MIRTILHCGLHVSSLEDTLHFFHDLLGLEIIPIREVTSARMANARVRVCNIVAPGGGNVEFTQRVAPEGAQKDPKASNGGGAHIAFAVDDILKTCHKLTAKGIEFRLPPDPIAVGPFQGQRVCFVQGPDGITLEFIEVPKGD